MKKNFGEKNKILTTRGSYFWNKEIKVVLDIEKFEKYCEKAKKATKIEDKMEYYEQDINIYQGDFVSQILDRHWALTASAYYHSLFLTNIKNLCDIYLQKD